MGGFAIGVTEFATMSLLPYFAKDLAVDAPTAGHAISAYPDLYHEAGDEVMLPKSG